MAEISTCISCHSTLRETRAWASGHTEASGGHPEGADILLRLEQDDVNLGSEEAAQHHRPTQTDRDAHGGGLHLEEEPDVGRSHLTGELPKRVNGKSVVYVWFKGNGMLY